MTPGKVMMSNGFIVLLKRQWQLSTGAVLLSGLLFVSGCGGSSTPTASSPAAAPESTTTPQAALSTTSPSPSPAATPNTSVNLTTPTSPSSGKVTVTVYKSDDQCVKFVPELVDLPSDRPLEAAIGEVLKSQQNAGDFDMSGYRVSIDEASRTATVDLRMAPGSKRQIVSLAACEQFSLFGALRKTLTENPNWNIKDVRFTERGKDIVL